MGLNEVMILRVIMWIIQVKPISCREKQHFVKVEIKFYNNRKKALLALTNIEHSMDIPKSIPKSIFKKENDLNVVIAALINAVRKSEKEKPLLALTDAKPSMNIRKSLFKKQKTRLLY